MNWKKTCNCYETILDLSLTRRTAIDFAKFAELIYSENVRPGRRTQHISVVLYNLS